MKIWNSNQDHPKYLSRLPKGSYMMGNAFLRDADPVDALSAAEALVGKNVSVSSQSEAIVKAQELGLEFQDWMKLRLM